MGKVKLVLLLVDHICEPGPKVRVDERTILEFEFETCVQGNDQRRFPTYGYNRGEYT